MHHTQGVTGPADRADQCQGSFTQPWWCACSTAARLYREVTDHVQYVSPANGIACYHGNDWLGQPPNLDLHACETCECPLNNIEWVWGFRVSEYCEWAHCPLEHRKLTVLWKAHFVNVNSETPGQCYQALLLLECILNPNPVGIC